MAKGTLSIRIDRPQQEVFDYVANLENAPQWVPDLLMVKKITEGDIGVGTKYHEIIQMGKNKGEARLEITEYNPPYSVAHEGEGGPSRFMARFTCTPDGSGTMVQHDYSVTMSGMAKLMMPIIAGWVKKNSDQAMHQLKENLES